MIISKKHILEAKNRQGPGAPTWLKCCATCEKLSDSGYCEAFGENPPPEFIEQENDCEQYQDTIPF
jgi:hypothetical protein